MSSKDRFHVFVCLWLFVGSGMLSACSKVYYFNKSSIVPAARGKVRLSTDRNGNYAVNVKITNLAKPDDIREPGAVYTMWMQSPVNGTRNLGRIRSTKTLFGAMKASLKTSTPFAPTKFIITAEERSDVLMPDYRHVLETDRVD